MNPSIKTLLASSSIAIAMLPWTALAAETASPTMIQAPIRPPAMCTPATPYKYLISTQYKGTKADPYEAGVKQVVKCLSKRVENENDVYELEKAINAAPQHQALLIVGLFLLDK